MSTLRITAGQLVLVAQLEERAAPRTCSVVRGLLPLGGKLAQARWSGEAAWLGLGEPVAGLTYENHTSRPAPGDLVLYPGGVGPAEIVLPYGLTLLGGPLGPLAANHFATVLEGYEHLPELGRLVLWQGAQDVRFELEDR